MHITLVSLKSYKAVCSLEKIPLKKLSNAKMINLIGNRTYKIKLKLNMNFLIILKRDKR